MTIVSAADIVTGGLREIGVLSPYDDGADPAQYAIALDCFAIMMDELVGTSRLWWFVPMDQQITLTADRTEYNLLGSTTETFEFVDEIELLDENGNSHEVELVRRSTFDKEYPEYASGVETGRFDTKRHAYVERKDRPKLFIYPAPTVAGWKANITGRTYAKDVRQSGGQVAHGFPAAWQRFLRRELAVDLGAGPITTLSLPEQAKKEQRAAKSEYKLNAAHNRENVRKPRFIKPRQF